MKYQDKLEERPFEEDYEILHRHVRRLNINTNSPIDEIKTGHFFVDKDVAETGFRVFRVINDDGRVTDISQRGYVGMIELRDFIATFNEGILAYKFPKGEFDETKT